MKAYVHLGTYYAPGQQPKGATALDIPTDSKGLVAWINEHLVPAEEPQAAPEVTIGGLKVVVDHTMPPDIAELRQSHAQATGRIDEAHFEAQALPYQLHLAALALENARSRLK